MQLISLMKEIAMNDELEISELGDAKQEIKGPPGGLPVELGTEMMYRPE
jgi:hypothetical protein